MIYPLSCMVYTGNPNLDKTAILEIPSMHGPWYPSIWREVWIPNQTKEQAQQEIYEAYGRISKQRRTA